MHVLPVGQYINHEIYGLGVVTDSDSERTTVDFDAYGLKKFVTSIMTADLVGEAPAKSARPKRRSRRAAAVSARV